MCDDSHVRITVNMDKMLLERAVKASGERSTAATVRRALVEFVALHEQKHLADLLGALEWDPQYDYKAGRSRVHCCPAR